MPSSQTNVHIIRLHPNDDLKLTLLRIAKELKLKAGYIITCVGSLQVANLRYANATVGQAVHEKMEIVSLVGTLYDEGCHLHISLANREGHMIGGHLLDGCLIYTTAEIVIGEALAYQFSREIDPTTGYQELRISQN